MLSYLTLIVLSLAASASARPMEQGNFYGSSHYPWSQQQQQQQQNPSSFASEMYSIQHQPYDHNAGIPLQPYVQYSDPTQGGGPMPMGGPFPLQPLYQYPTPVPFHPVQPYPPPNLHHSSQQYPAPIPHQTAYAGMPATPPPNSNVLAGHSSGSISTYYETGYPPAESHDYDTYGQQGDLSAQFADMSLVQPSHRQTHPQWYQPNMEYADHQIMLHQPLGQDLSMNSDQSFPQHQHHRSYASSSEGEEGNSMHTEKDKRELFLRLFSKEWEKLRPIPKSLTPQELANRALYVLAKLGLKASINTVIPAIVEPLLPLETKSIFHDRLDKLWRKYSDLKRYLPAGSNLKTPEAEQARIDAAQKAIHCFNMMEALAPLPPSLVEHAQNPRRDTALCSFLQFLSNRRANISVMGSGHMEKELETFIQSVKFPEFTTNKELMEMLVEYVWAIRPEYSQKSLKRILKFSKDLDDSNVQLDESSSSH